MKLPTDPIPVLKQQQPECDMKINTQHQWKSFHVDLSPVGSGFISGTLGGSCVVEWSLLPGDRCLLNLLSAILSAYIAKGIPTLDLLSPGKYVSA